MWESNAKYTNPILSVISASLIFRDGMLLCRRGILGLAGLSPIVLHTEDRMMSR